MSEWIIPGRFDFSIPDAQRLSDLTSVDSDLEAVIRICNRCESLSAALAKIPESAPLTWMDDLEALGDLVFAAVIRYGRTAASGVRQSIPRDWIDALPKAAQESHEYFKALRDKYVAHSVSQLEDNQVFVILTPQFAEDQQPSSVTVDKGRLVTLGTSDLARLRSLAEALRAVVSREIQSETGRLLAIAREMPVAQIKARGSESIPIPGKDATFRVRSGFK